MRTEEKIMGTKLGLLKLAKSLGNVSEACKAFANSDWGRSDLGQFYSRIGDFYYPIYERNSTCVNEAASNTATYLAKSSALGKEVIILFPAKGVLVVGVVSITYSIYNCLKSAKNL